VVWGTGLPAPRVIPELEDICWISGPYAVGCNGQLFHAEISRIVSGEIAAVVSPVEGVAPIWRVNADRPIDRLLRDDPDEDGIQQVRSLTLGYVAIAVDGTVYELDRTSATVRQ
jgi:hypothetical protein